MSTEAWNGVADTNSPPGVCSDRAAERALYEQYLPLVRRIAIRITRRLPREVSLEDVLSAGWLGLVEALRRRSSCPTEDQFEAYAVYRIRGAILDYLRSLDPMSRRYREASRAITSAIQSLTQQLGRPPSEEEIAGHLGLELDSYCDLLNQVARFEPIRLEVTGAADILAGTDAGPDALLSDRELVSLVAEGIQRLPERLQLVLGLYYQEDCSLAEIGKVLGVSESRVCQMHTECIHRLRAYLETTFAVSAAAAAKTTGRPEKKEET